MKKLLSVILCIAVLMLFAGCTGGGGNVEDFTPPENYTSVVQVTINPTVNLYLDGEGTILAVEYVNKDAKETYSAIEKELVGSKIEKGVDLVIERANEKGYFDKNEQVKIDMLESKDQSVVDSTLNAVRQAAKAKLEKESINAEITVSLKGERFDKTENSQNGEENNKPGFSATDKTESDKGNEDNIVAEPPQAVDKEQGDNKVSEVEKNPSIGETTQKPEEDNGGRLPEGPVLDTSKQYSYFKAIDIPDMIEGYTFKFEDDGTYTYAKKPYSLEKFDQSFESVEFEGKTYYECGGLGGDGTYAIEGEHIKLSGGMDMLLKIDTAGLRVMSCKDDDFFEGVAILEPR